MQKSKTVRRLIGLLLAVVIFASPVLAQQRRSTPSKRPAPAVKREPVPTFDTLLAADTYKVYCEIRGTGALIQSAAVNDLLDPLMKLSNPSKEFKTVVKWLRAHADVLAGSRMLVAAWPSRSGLPMVVAAIEFSSPEEAKKFYPELRDFLPTLMPTPTPTPTPVPAAKSSPLATNEIDMQTKVELAPMRTTADQTAGVDAAPQPTPSLPPYQMTQAGSLILISDKSFNVRDLRPPNSTPLADDENFLQARSRFASESVFLYIDLKAIDKEEKEQQKKWEEEAKKRAEAEAANPPKTEPSPEEEMPSPPVMPPPPPSEPPAGTEPEVIAATAEPQGANDSTLSAGPSPAFLFPSLYGAFLGGESKSPDAIGAALVFEGDAYIVRTLLLNKPENKNSAIPFVPQFITGPAIAPESPGIFPADVDLFVTVSLDYPQIYDGILKALTRSEEQAKKYRGPFAKDEPPPEPPFAVYEKKLGLKIDADLLPLLGHELALVLPKKVKPANDTSAKPTEDAKVVAGAVAGNANAGPNPIIAISVKDREAVRRLLPKIIEALGLKGANLLAQSEKRDGTEIVSYAGLFFLRIR